MESPHHDRDLGLNDQLCFALYNASRTLIRAYGPLLRDVGLTYPQYLVMLALWDANRAVSVGDLGDAMHLDNGTLTPLLKRLVQQGLIERERDPDDERRVLITLSSRGHELHGQVTEIPATVARLCDIDAQGARDLRDTLSKLVRSVEQGGTPDRTGTGSLPPAHRA